MARIRTHPGEILREEFLQPLNMSARQLAEKLQVPANRMSEIANIVPSRRIPPFGSAASSAPRRSSG